MKFIVFYLGKFPVRFLSHHNYEVVAEEAATKFKTKRAARLAAKFAGLRAHDRKIKTVKTV